MKNRRIHENNREIICSSKRKKEKYSINSQKIREITVLKKDRKPLTMENGSTKKKKKRKGR